MALPPSSSKGHGTTMSTTGAKGEADAFRLFIPDTLECCIFRSGCLTFEPGSLFEFMDSDTGAAVNESYVNAVRFDVCRMEVWACGGEELLIAGEQAQRATRERKDAVIAKARQVDKAQFFNNPFDREYLLSETLSGTGSNDKDQLTR
jgi:hypothetical protein